MLEIDDPKNGGGEDKLWAFFLGGGVYFYERTREMGAKTFLKKLVHCVQKYPVFTTLS